ISFMNELANIAEQLGADIEHVRLGIGSDPRIGYEFIYPGCGYGGSCFPKDVRALIASATAAGYKADILPAAHGGNQPHKHVMFEKIGSYYDGDLDGKRIALWGLAFKPNTDDMREATSRVLMEALWNAGAIVQAYDPVAREQTRAIYGDRPDLVLCEKAEDALAGADGLAIVTEWREFRSPDFELIRSSLREPVIFDGRNIYDPKLLQRMGFRYFAIGRGESVVLDAAPARISA